MKRVRDIVLLIALAILPVFAQQGSGPRSASTTIRYAGAWWQSIPSDERRGFLAGVDDCLTYDVHKPLRFLDSWNEYESVISRYYEMSPRNRDISVVKVVRTKLRIKPRTRDFKTPDYERQWWSEASPQARRGFIEGLTSCRIESKRGIVWNVEIDACVRQLDYVYDVGEVKHFNGTEYVGVIANGYRQFCPDVAR